MESELPQVTKLVKGPSERADPKGFGGLFRTQPARWLVFLPTQPGEGRRGWAAAILPRLENKQDKFFLSSFGEAVTFRLTKNLGKTSPGTSFGTRL